MKKFLQTAAVAALITMPMMAQAAPEIGQPAPVFSATDINGQTFNLADQKGKVVVLEWTNHECPFVVKHYSTHNMQDTQKTVTDDGAVWVSVVSSAPGKQGHTTAEKAGQIVTEQDAHPSVKILDESGEIGHLYEAKTTPHMFVIDAEGKLAYMGAIDDNSSPQPDTVKGAKNYVLAAVNALKSGQAVETSSTQPYGCGVKY